MMAGGQGSYPGVPVSAPQLPARPFPAYGMGPTTADGVVLAGWWARAAAAIVDSLLLSPLAIGMLVWLWPQMRPGIESYMVIAMGGGQPDILDPSLGLRGPILLVSIVMDLALLVYGVGMLAWSGSTLGMKMAGIRVVPLDQGRYQGGLPLTTCLVRHVLYIALGVISIVAIINCLLPLFTAKRQALHDLLGNTQVVRVR